jgi:hypothetical protein
MLDHYMNTNVYVTRFSGAIPAGSPVQVSLPRT